jgi:sigma-B regulation protein RsbU (phosphoserine phosphatase)
LTIYTEEKLQLTEGDRLVLYSDGIIEALNPEKVSFGKDNLKASLHRSVTNQLPESFKKVLRDVKEWCKPGRPTDDLTILGIEIKNNK